MAPPPAFRRGAQGNRGDFHLCRDRRGSPAARSAAGNLPLAAAAGWVEGPPPLPRPPVPLAPRGGGGKARPPQPQKRSIAHGGAVDAQIASWPDIRDIA